MFIVLQQRNALPKKKFQPVIAARKSTRARGHTTTRKVRFTFLKIPFTFSIIVIMMTLRR